MKKAFALLLTLTMVFALCACGGAPAAAPAAPAAEAPAAEAPAAEGAAKVGIAMPTQSLERWNRDGQFLDEQFQAAGYETILTFSDNDTNRQVADVQNMIADGVKLLVIAAIDGEALNTVMDEAAAAGIPVIAYDRLIQNAAVKYYVSFDNYTVGKLQGEYVRDALDLDNADGPFVMEFTAGDPADTNAGYFFNGAMDVIKPYIEAGKVVITSGQNQFEQVATPTWGTDVALERAQNILSSYYADGTKLDAWLCSNDSTSLGVAQALASDYNGGNQPITTGQDGDEANLKNIKDGKQSMTVYKNVANEAVVTVDLGKAILSGAAVDEALIAASGWAFDCAYDTASYEPVPGQPCTSFLLVPDVVTADNMVEKLVDTGLYVEGEDGYLKAAN